MRTVSRAAFLLVAGLAAIAAPPPPGIFEEPYLESDVMIPMRDGIKLHTKIFRPRSEHSPLPILIERTPYGMAELGGVKVLEGPLKALADDGYILVFHELRGSFGPEGHLG